MPPLISYRAARTSDAAAMLGVHFAAVQAIDSFHYADDIKRAWSPPPNAARQEWLSGLVSRDSVVCRVALRNETILIGFCIALPHEAQLKALYVHPDHCGSGVAKTLLRQVESQCRALGVEVLELKASHNAVGFYRHSGYQAVGPTTQPLSDTVSMAAIHMTKRLPDAGESILPPDPPRRGRLQGGLPAAAGSSESPAPTGPATL
jgi:putative acetyltransferase